MAELKKWLDRKEIFALLGPRQSGKTTLLRVLEQWLKQEKKVKPEQIVFLTFEDREILEKFSADPKAYVKSFMAQKTTERFYFFIDEFQYLTDGGRTLKLLYDIFNNIKFIVTGSSSLELTGKTAKFLVGRVFYFHLWQLSFSEFVQARSAQLFYAYQEKNALVKNFLEQEKNFSLPQTDIFREDFKKLFEEYALWGGYPEVVKAGDAETKTIILKNIYDTYVTKDIIELLKITDYAALKKLTALLAAQIGGLVNYQSLARDAQSYWQEIKNHLTILEQTYIISLISPYSTNRATEIKKNPKVYFIDIGLRNYIVSGFQDLSLRPDLGSIVENIIFSQLKFKEPEEYGIKYWRTIAKAEMDFILPKKESVLPLEVKYSSFDSPKISRGFRGFISEYRPRQAVILTKGFWGELRLESTLIKFIPAWYW
ncbi:MAG: ATP-binding protein [Parcubacteria group bacterium]|nr:ATP-binding protein [Parcubacteria group bacterium]